MPKLMFLALFVGVLVGVTSGLRVLGIAGAAGRVGRELLNELIAKDLMINGEKVRVKALVRDGSQLKDMEGSVEVVECNLSNDEEVLSSISDVDAVIWVASGFSDRSSKVNQLLSAFKLKFFPTTCIDIKTVSLIGTTLAASNTAKGIVDNGPKVVLCSSAGVTRPFWNEKKKLALEGSADIPIVRLNPLNILGVKRDGEESLRETGVPYTIVRPCGLNDKWPLGRPVLSQYDVAVGRTNRKDVARVIIDTISNPACVGKTFEVFTLANYPYPIDLTRQFQRLLPDIAVEKLSEEALFNQCYTQYALLQQLVPGETMEPNKLAMGQTYEQLDKGEEGRLGPRGSEDAPVQFNN